MTMERATYKCENDMLLRLVGDEYYLSIEQPKQGDTVSFKWNEYTVEYKWWNHWDKVDKKYLDNCARRKVNELKANIKVAKQDGTLITYKYDKRIPDPVIEKAWPLTETYRLIYLD